MSNPKQATFASAGRTSQHVIPAAYSRFASAGSRAGFSSSSNLVFLGTCRGMKPAEIQWFNGSVDAIKAIRGGNLVEIAREAFDAGDNLVPQQIGFVRINTATQSALVLKNGVTDIVRLKSADYGLDTTQIYAKVEAGDVSGKKVTAKWGTVIENTRDIEKKSLSIKYNGVTATTCVMSITNTGITTTTGTPSVPADDLAITFADYPTIEGLVAAINGNANYTAVVTAANSQDPSAQLDNITASDIKTALVNLYSSLQAFLDSINTQMAFIVAELVTSAPRLIPDNLVYTKLAGGTEGASTSSEWGAALTYLESQNVQLIGIDRTDPAIHALISAHVTKMNQVDGKSERRALLGGATSLANTQAVAQADNNFAVAYCWGAFDNYNVNGIYTGFTSEHYAAKLLAQAATLALNTPMTFKGIKVQKLTTILTKIQKEAAILAGVIVPELAASGNARTVRSVTSYQGDDLKYAEWSMVGEMLFMTKDLRELLENTFIGKAGTPAALVSVESVAKDRLVDYEKELQIIMADPTDKVNSPAWWDFQWSVTGDTIRIQFKARIVSPINFIFTTHYFDILATV